MGIQDAIGKYASPVNEEVITDKLLTIMSKISVAIEKVNNRVRSTNEFMFGSDGLAPVKETLGFEKEANPSYMTTLENKLEYINSRCNDALDMTGYTCSNLGVPNE